MRPATACANRPTSSAPTIIRLIDLLASALDEPRQGGDPRLPLEVALVRWRDRMRISHESRLRTGSSCWKSGNMPGTPPRSRGPPPPSPRPRRARLQSPRPFRWASARAPSAAPAAQPDSPAPALAREHSRTPGRGASSRACRSAPHRPQHCSGEARPAPSTATSSPSNSRPMRSSIAASSRIRRNLALLGDVLHELTGRRLPCKRLGRPGVACRRGRALRPSEEDFLSLLTDTFDVTEVDER